MTWVDDYLKQQREWEKELQTPAYHPQGMKIGESAEFFERDNKSGVEEHGNHYQGMGEMLSLTRADIQQLLDGKILAIGVNSEYQLLIIVTDETE